MIDKSKLEIKLGIFVFFALVILVFLVLSIGDFRTWNTGYNIFVEFGFINGVKIGAPVRFAGVDVGEVEDIDIILDPQTKTARVKVLAWVNNKAQIPVNSTVWVNTLGLLGEKYIEIIAGDNFDKFLKHNDTIVGEDPIAMHEVAQLAKKLATDIDESIVRLNKKEGTVGRLLYDDKLYQDLEELVGDIKNNPWKLLYKTREKR